MDEFIVDFQTFVDKLQESKQKDQEDVYVDKLCVDIIHLSQALEGQKLNRQHVHWLNEGITSIMQTIKEQMDLLDN